VSCALIIRPEAEADLAEGFDWYEQRRSGLGNEFLNEVNTLLRQIEANPLGHPLGCRTLTPIQHRQEPTSTLAVRPTSHRASSVGRLWTGRGTNLTEAVPTDIGNGGCRGQANLWLTPTNT
jgi:hypothetical protein